MRVLREENKRDKLCQDMQVHNYMYTIGDYCKTIKGTTMEQVPIAQRTHLFWTSNKAIRTVQRQKRSHLVFEQQMKTF